MVELELVGDGDVTYSCYVLLSGLVNAQQKSEPLRCSGSKLIS